MFDEVTKVCFLAEVQVGAENRLFQLCRHLVRLFLEEHDLVIMVANGVYIAEKSPGRQHQFHRLHRQFGKASKSLCLKFLWRTMTSCGTRDSTDLLPTARSGQGFKHRCEILWEYPDLSAMVARKPTKTLRTGISNWSRFSISPSQRRHGSPGLSSKNQSLRIQLGFDGTAQVVGFAFHICCTRVFLAAFARSVFSGRLAWRRP